MEVHMNGRTAKPSHLYSNDEPKLAPRREKWSPEARQLDDLVSTTTSDVLYLGFGGVTNGCGTDTLFCAPELGLGLQYGFGENSPQYLPSARLQMTGYCKIHLPLKNGCYRGVGTIAGPSEEYLFRNAKMHMCEQLRLWRTEENIFAPLLPTRPLHFYADMDVETTFYYRLEMFDFGIMLYGKVDGIPDGAERFMLELVQTTLPLFEAFRSLEPLYRHEDAEGNRLWIDQRMQSKAYYRHAENLARDIEGAVKRIARRHGMPIENTHSLLGMFRHAPLEMLFRTIHMPRQLLNVMRHRTAGYFRHQLWRVKKLFR